MILDNAKMFNAVKTSSTATSTPVVFDNLYMWEAIAYVTDSTPGNKAFTSANVNTGSSTITITGHGLLVGLAVQFTTSGTLPTGLAVLTTYYVIVVDANTVKLATSQANALTGTFITLSGAGAGSSSMNPQALAGSIKFQKNNEKIENPPTGNIPVWVDVLPSSQTISAGNSNKTWFSSVANFATWQSMQSVLTVTSGQATVTLRINAKGL